MEPVDDHRDSARDTAAYRRALDTEQQHLERVYRLLDAERHRLEGHKVDAMAENDGTPSGMFTRDAWQYRYAQRLAMLAAVEDKLCFGRLDTDDGESVHIGRMGLADDSPGRRQVLMDWRAPLAAPFYTATALKPQHVVRRRHIRTKTRSVESISDELLKSTTGVSAEWVDEIVDGGDLGVGGDAALVEALQAPRTGRMGDIIATIQAEQDEIIRADHRGVLVVQGGPGTGKTVVALHRAAYLLYTYRERLGSHGVLVIGPNQTFLDYIGQVLPSLGETSVVLATIGTLVPGIAAGVDDAPDIAAIKGQSGMTTILDHAVLDRQRIPGRDITVPYDRGTVTLDAALLERAQRRAWASKRPHNQARGIFVRVVLAGLAQQVADRPGVASLDPDAAAPDHDQLIRELAGDTAIRGALATIWPAITARRLVAELFSDPARLAVAAPEWSAARRAAMLRPAGSPVTISDIPLIDEAAELLGEIPESERATQAALAEELSYARDTLQALGAEEAGFSDSGISFTLSMLSADDIARLHDTSGPEGSTADRAAADRRWTYGHVVVDEAQELSPMAWRAVFRRCPAKSMTAVGDVAQASGAAAMSSWADALAPHARDRWHQVELTVNYRTPAEVMALSEPLLAAINPAAVSPSSVRKSGELPWVVTAPDAIALPEIVADCVAGECDEMAAGQLAVLHAGGAGATPRLLAAVRRRVPDAAAEAGPGRRVVVLPVEDAKGLEFDRVILAEPADIAAREPHGLSDLYVAMTRATQQLGLVHAATLPDVIDAGRLRGWGER